MWRDKIVIREYEPKDCKELAGLFYNTVHTVDAKDYTKEQLDAWATGKIDLEKWNQSFQEHYSIVAVDGEITIGFGDIDKTGYLDRLYVHKDYQGKGVATICTNLIKILAFVAALFFVFQQKNPQNRLKMHPQRED